MPWSKLGLDHTNLSCAMVIRKIPTYSHYCVGWTTINHSYHLFDHGTNHRKTVDNH